ncbi:hypothetical protein NKJ09_22675 [Mesorhizobium sp. M0189]|uniref:hypothetical protein n=1 Tax=Mesorhizobium sp. M0189 TaxID=2956909 RepID=UPI00333D824C
MAFSNVNVLDGSGLAIPGGVKFVDVSGTGVGPHLTTHALVDAAGVNVAAISAGGALSVADPQLHTDLLAIEGYVDGIEGLLTTLNGKDFATQTTLAALLAAHPAALGQGTMAQSLRVVLPSDQSALSARSAEGIVTATVDVTRPADTTTYAVNDALSDSTSSPTVGGFTFASCVRAAGKTCILSDLIVTSSNPAPTALQGEIHIYDSAVTAINDNAAFAVSDAEIKTLVAKVPFVMTVGTNNNHVHVQNLGIALTAVGSRDFRFLVKVLNAYVPANGEVITFRGKFVPVD